VLSRWHYPQPNWKLRSAAGGFLIALTMPAWAVIAIAAGLLRFPRSFQTWLIRLWMNFVAKVYEIRWEVSGAENHDPSVASLVITNHQSLLDVPGAFAAVGGHLRMLANAGLFSIPFFGWVLRPLGFIPVQGANKGSAHKASVEIARKLREGFHIWVAPEGWRSDLAPEMEPFRPGSFGIAIQTSRPIQPIVMVNAYDVCPKGSLLPKPGATIRILILPRVPTTGWQVADREKLMLIVRSQMEIALHEALRTR
jgi:1-acyl-sn-glycerol-3-phosphate acyltransferase